MRRFKKDINPANGRYELPVVHSGRTFMLIKREDAQTPEGPWYLRMKHQRKPYWRCTGTNDAELAQNKAKTHIDAILGGDQHAIEANKLRDPLTYATVQEVCDLYEKCSTVVRPRGPVNTLRSILRNVYGQDTNVGKLTVDQLTGKVVRTYQANVVEAVRKQELDEDDYRTALRRAQGTANSTWNQARCLFTDGSKGGQNMMAIYRDADLHFPPTFQADFVNTPKIRGKSVKQPVYIQPADAVIQRTLEAHRRVMQKVIDGDLWVSTPSELARPGRKKKNLKRDGLMAQRAAMVCLELGAGLRNAEVKKARGSWFGEVNGAFCIMIPSNATKNVEPTYERLPGEFEHYIRTYIAKRKIGPNDRLVPGGEYVSRAVSRWMRRLGWDGTKTNHALRAYFGYRIVVDHGMAVGQSKLRHKQIGTTQNSYVGIISRQDVVVNFGAPAKVTPMPAPTSDEKVVALRVSSP